MLTVITPTYNRAYILERCYASLCSQSNMNFIWLIVDDGSTDDTEKKVKEWICENRIKIKYVKKKNGGKASALNVGLDFVETPFVCCLDSDDIFYPSTIEIVLKEFENITNDSKCCGILALRNNPDGSVMGGVSIPIEFKNITATDVFLKLNLKTELICFYKSDVIKMFRFPEFKNERFVSPAWMQYKVCEKFYYRTSHDKLCQCEYIPDGLTKNKKKIILQNPRGYSCVKKYSFDNSTTLRLLIKHGIMYDCGCILAKDKEWLKNVKHKIWAIILFPLAIIIERIRFGKVK